MMEAYGGSFKGNFRVWDSVPPGKRKQKIT
jgi:hypothetical protein